MIEFLITLTVIALIFILATILVALLARALLKLRKGLSLLIAKRTGEPSISGEELRQEPPTSSLKLRICARNTPWS